MKFRSKSVVAAIMLWPASQAGGGPVANEAVCSQIERHAPAPDVAYQPGVDVRGRAVVPADASPYGQVATPQQIAIDLSLPLRNLGQPPARLGEAEAQLGQVAVDLATNRLTFNGQPLTDPALAELVAACRASRGG